MWSVIFVSEQRKLEILFMKVIINLLQVLIWFIVMCGMLIRLLLPWVQHIFLTIVDDYSRAVWIFLMSENMECQAFSEFYGHGGHTF